MFDFHWWLPVKDALVAITGLERDALHIYCGLAIQLATALFLTKGVRDWRVLLPLLLLTLGNEAADFAYERWPRDARLAQYLASVHDLLNTLAVPALLTLVARRVHAAGLRAGAAGTADPAAALVAVDRPIDELPAR